MCLSVNNCCCCVTLGVGTKIISILCTITAAVSVLVYGTAAATDTRLPAARWVFYVVMASTAMVQFVCGCLLIYGAYASAPKLTWPWTAVSWLKSICLALLSVIGIVLLHYNKKMETTPNFSSVIFAYFIYAITLFYFAAVVNSRRQQMVVEARENAAKRLVRHRVLPTYYVPSR